MSTNQPAAAEISAHVVVGEERDGHVITGPASSRSTLPVLTQPTQVRRPWRSTIRTVFQGLVALASLVPFLITGVYNGDADYPAVVVQVLAVSGTITRVMALPQVEDFLRRFAPWLAAAPAPKV